MGHMKRFRVYHKPALHFPWMSQVSVGLAWNHENVLTFKALFTAISPSACCAVTMNADGDVKLRKMVYSVGDVEQIKEDDGMLWKFFEH